ncbi:MAG: carboxymuconolactone decarboxylase family protein [Azospirillaceae bacterium]|nr:carboxymuconolactone decarboxylase family protein [Azospirillaceae bacterium]
MRLPDLDLSTLSDQQRVLYDRIGGKRGHVRGPFLIWLRSAGLCDRVEALGAYLRFDTKLPERIRELSILVTARFWDAQYSWAAHSGKAIQAGVDATAVEDLAQGRVPRFTHDDEQVFYDFATELLTTHFVSQDTYDRAHATFGEEGLVDIIGAMGNFSMLAMCLNTFQVQLRAEQKAPFPDIVDFKKVKA